MWHPLSMTMNSIIYDDEFNGPSLNTNWHWQNEDPNRWSLIDSPGNLRIITANGDLFNPCGFTAKNVLLQQGPGNNFEIETYLSFSPTQNYQQSGLLVMNDLETYVKMSMAWNSQQFDGPGIAMVFVKDGDIDQRTRLSADLSQPLYLKISKTGPIFTGYYGLDGLQYNKIDTFITSDIPNPQIGLIAINSCFTSPSEIPADFDFFHVNILTDRTIYLPLIAR